MLTFCCQVVAGRGSVGVRDRTGVYTNVFLSRGEERGFGPAGKEGVGRKEEQAQDRGERARIEML